MSRVIIHLGLFTLMLCGLSESRPDGAPLSACSTMTPKHRGYEPQRSQSAFTVDAIFINNKVRVKIHSKVGEEFIGFILQARARDSNKIIDGTFTEKNGETKAINCGGKRNTLTQTGPTRKMDIVTEFTPAQDVNGAIIFRATVLKTFEEFWIDIDSESIMLTGSKGAESHEGDSLRGSSVYPNCMVKYGCFGLPNGCVARTDCEVLLTYSKSNTGIRFTLHGHLEANEYEAVGLSGDRNMGDDMVMECYPTSNSRVNLRRSWNSGKTNNLIEEIPRNTYQGEYNDGLATCSWTVENTFSANGRLFNIENETYFLLLAKGPMRSNSLSYHSQRLASSESVNLTTFESLSAAGVTDAVKIHGTFMLTAWIGFMSLGIIFARYFKEAFENKKMGGLKLWFVFHRGFMLLGIAFLLVALIVIFIHKNGWNYSNHAILGVITSVLGIFQPIMAAFRPAPDHPKRQIFNYLHRFVGFTALILSIITIFYAKNLASAGLNESFIITASAYVIVLIIFHILFSMQSCSSGKKKSTDLKMVDVNSSTLGNAGGIQNSAQGWSKNLEHDGLRILLLSIYCILVTVILLAFYAIIGVA